MRPKLTLERATGSSLPFQTNTEVGKSQYDTNISPDNIDQLNELRAQRQTRLDKLGNGLFNFGSTVLTSAAENMVGLPVGMISAMVEQDPAALYNNAFTKEFIDPIKDWSRENMPFYSSEAEQNAGLLEGMKYSNFWFDKVFGGVGYTVGAMVSGMGLSKMYGLGKLATAGKLAEGAEGVLANIGKSNRMLGFINKDAGKELMIGLGMAHGESAAEARDTYNQMIKDGYSEAEAEAAANKNYVTNLFITGATNYALLRKTFRPSYKDAVELNAVRSVETKGEGNVVKSLLEDATLSDKNRYVKGRAIKFLEGVAEEGGQEGAQFASDQLWRKYEALQNDPKTKDQAGNFMNALGEALSETFGSKEGLENILIGGITGGPFGLKGVRGEMQRKEQLTKQYVDAINADPEFKNLVYSDILSRSNQKLKLGDAVSAIAFFDKADEAMLKGDKFNYHNAKFNGLAQVVKMMSENNTLDVFKERLEAMKELDLNSFSEQFDAKPKDTADQHEQVDTLLKSIDSIEKSYNQTREFFNMNKYQGDTQDPLDIELNKVVFDQLFFSSVNLNNIEEREKAVAKEIKAMSSEAAALFKMREYALLTNNESTTNEDLKNELPEAYKDMLKETSGLDYDKFRKELGDSYRDKFNDSLKKFSEKNPHIAPKLNELLGDLNKLAEAREAFIHNYNKLTTVEGRKQLKEVMDGTKEQAVADIKKAQENFEKKSFIKNPGDVNKLGNKEAVEKMQEANLAAMSADNEADLQNVLGKLEEAGVEVKPEVVEAKKQEIAENKNKAEQERKEKVAGVEQSLTQKFIGSNNFLNTATINPEQRGRFNDAFNSPNFLDRISIRVRPAQHNAPGTIKPLNDKLNQKSSLIDVEILFDGNPQPIAFLNWYGRYVAKNNDTLPISIMSNAEINNLFNLPDGVTPEKFKEAYEANLRFYNYLESLLGTQSEINLSNEELKALTNITGTHGLFNPLGYETPKSPLEDFKDRLIKNEHGQFIILDRHGYSIVDGQMKRLSENTPRSFGNALLNDENELNPIYTELVEKIKQLNESGILKDRYVTLFEDAGGAITIGDKKYSVIPITPSKIDMQPAINELLDKAKDISDKHIEAEELDAWNKQFNDKFFISNTVNSVVQIELGYQGKCRINFYKNKVASNIIVDLNKVLFPENFINEVNKQFKTAEELSKSGAKDVKQYKDLVDNFKPLSEKNFKVVVAEQSQVGNVAADENLLKQFETPYGQNIKINQELSFDFKNVPAVSKPVTTSAPTTSEEEEEEDISDEDADAMMAANIKKPSNVSDEVNDLINGSPVEINNNTNIGARFNSGTTQEWTNHETAVANLTSILPSGIDTALMDRLVTNVFDKNDLMGAFLEDTIYLGEAVEKGTEYHEAFHAIFRTMLNDSEITLYLQAGKNELRDKLAKSGKSFVQAVEEFKADPRNAVLVKRLTQQQIEDLVVEEYMADKFMDYKNAGNKPKTGLARIFEMILDFFNIFKNNQDELSLLFKRIDKGQYRNKSSVDNRFSKSKDIVSALITTDRKGGTLNPEVQSNLINTVTASVLSKLTENTNKPVATLINEALNENSLVYDPRKYDNLSDETQLFLAKQCFARDGFGNNPQGRKIITDSVLKLLKAFEIDEDTTELESTVDEFGERSYVLNAENYGGFGSLSKEIRRDIALTTYTTTLNQLYNRNDLPNVEITSGIDAKKVYDGLVKATANSVTDDQLISRFMGYAEHSEQAKHYVDKVISKTNFQIGEQGATVDENQKNYFQRVLKAFNLFSVDHRFLALDSENRTSRMMSANQRGMDTEQLITWAANFNDSYRTAFATPDGIAKLTEKFNNINNLLSGGYRPGIKNSKLNVTQLNDRVDKLFYALQDVKIDLCKGYIKYLLLTHPGRMADDLLTKEQKEFVENYQDEFEINNTSFSEHISQIAGVIARGSNPFTKEADKQKDEDKESAVSRLKMLARDNSVLDERVAVTNFKNAENKSVYAYQQPTFHLIKAIELRNESNATIRKRITEYKNNTEKYADKQKDNTLGRTFAAIEKFRIDNQLSLSEAYKKIQKKLTIIRADGGRVTKLFARNGQLEEVSNIDRQEGVTFGKFTKRDFILYSYGLYLDRSTHNGTITSPVILPIMEASSTLDHVDLPSIQCFNSKEGITHNFTSAIYKEIERELSRITDFNNGLFEKEIPGYTTASKGERARASYFWKWEKLLLTNLSQEDINKIASGEASLESYRDEIEKSIKDYFGSELQEHLKMLEDEEVIDYNAKENKYYSKLLDKRFYTGSEHADYLKKDGLTAVFTESNLTANISQVYLSNYLNTMFFCQLLEGDPALNAKDTTDFFKRQRGANGAGPSFTASHLRSNIPFLVLDDAKSALPIKDGKLDYSSDETQDVDRADAQANGNSQMFIHILDSLGRYDAAIKPIIEKLDDVDSPELTYAEQRLLKDYMAVANSYKIQGYDDKGQYLKTSVQFLFKKNLYYRSKDGTIKPKTKHMSLVKMYEAMESSGAILCGPKSFSKKAIYGISKTQFDSEGNISHIEPQLQSIDTKFLRLQMENPALKEEGKDPSQMQQITDMEQVDSTPYTNAMLSGIKTVGDLKSLWQNTLSQRSNAQFHAIERFLFKVKGNDRSPDFKNWIRSIQETIADTNGSPQLIQMLSELQEGTFNLPSHYEKFEQYFNAHFSDAFLHKTPSYKTTLVSDLGYKVLEDKKTGKIITSRMYNSNPDYYEELIAKGDIQARDLAYEKTEIDSQGNKRTYSEFMLPMHFAEQFGLKPGDEIPESIAYMFGLRIPTQDHHSALALKLVDILPSEAGSNAVFPKEIILLTGSDFDIDSFYIHRPDHYVKGEGESARFLQYGNKEDSEFEQYKRWQKDNNKIVAKLVKYFKQDSEFADKYQDRSDLVKQLKKDKYNLYGRIKEAKSKNVDKSEYRIIQHNFDQVEARLNTEQKILDAMDNDLLNRAFKELDLPTTEQEYKAAQSKGMEFNIGKLNNILLEAKIGFQTNDHIRKEITKTPASLTALEDVLSDLADIVLGDEVKDLSTSKKIALLDKSFDMFGLNAFAQALESNKAGKESIGAAVNSTQAFTFLNRYGLEVNKEGVIIINGQPLNNYKNSLNAQQVRIMDLLSTLTSAMTDNGKYGFVAKCNLTLATLGIASDFVMRGGKFKDAIFMLNTEFVKKYTKLAEGNNLQSNSENKNSKYRVAKKITTDLHTNIKALIKELHGTEITSEEINKFSNDISSEEIEWLVRNGVKENFEKLSKEDKLKYYELELRNFNNYVKLEQFNGNLISMAQILTLTKGLNTTHAESDIILEHLNKLGVRLTLNPDNTVSVVPTANENPPFKGFLEALLKNKSTLTNLKNLTKVLHNASFVQINRTPAFRSMFDLIKHNTSKWLTNKKFTYGKISKNLMSFLTIKAYRKFLQETKGNTLDLNSILYAKDDNNLYEDYAELMKDAEFSTNRFVLSLNVRPPADNGFIEITANTHSNKNKGFEERILDNYEALLVHSNPKYRKFAHDLYFYECSKNGFQFKTGSFINYIAPVMFKTISESSKTVNLLMRNNFSEMQDEDCMSVFGLDKENLVKEFVTLYAGDINNSNDSKYVSADLSKEHAISTNSTENMFTFDLYKGTQMQHDAYPSFNVNDVSEDIAEKVTTDEKIKGENGVKIKNNSSVMSLFFDRVSVGEKSYFKFPLWFRQKDSKDSIFRLVTVNNRVISYTGEPVYIGTKAVYEKIKMFGERSKASTYARTTAENNEVEIQHVFSSKKVKEKRPSLESRVGDIEDTSRMHEAFPDDEFDDFDPEEMMKGMKVTTEVAKAITGDLKDQKEEDKKAIEEEGEKKVTECKFGKVDPRMMGLSPE